MPPKPNAIAPGLVLYREAMELSPEQFLRFEIINMQKSVCQKTN
jgi:hypothetical protein